MVTLLEYGQVIYGKDAEAEAIAPVLKEETKSEVKPALELALPEKAFQLLSRLLL